VPEQPVQFGVLGCGRIAREAFAPAIRNAANAVLAAAASRDPQRASAMQARRVYSDYQALLDDPEVEAVYIATHNGLHRDLSLAALAAGKHVLCEKPLARDAAECTEVLEAAQAAGRHLAEAFMYRHHPQWARVQAWVEGGRIGELRTVEAAFSFHLERPEDVRLRPEWGGGALLDVGCYCVHACRDFLGDAPERVLAAASYHPQHKVDISLHGVLDYGAGRFGLVSCGFDGGLRNRVLLSGTDGTIEVPAPFVGWRQASELLLTSGRRTERHAVAGMDLFQLEIEDLARAIRGGRSPLLGPGDALANARLLDRLRDAARDDGGRPN